MISKKLAGIAVLILFSGILFAQVEAPVEPQGKEQGKKGDMKFSQRLVFGGEFGLSFGTITYIKVAPLVGYRITERLTAGLGPIYIYESYRDYNLRTSTYGGKAVASFTVLRGSDLGGRFGFGDVMLHVENEVVNVEPIYYLPITQGYLFGNRLWIDNLLVGGGISQSLGGRFALSVFILWDVTQNPYSPYSNPIFRFGFSF